MNLVLALLLTVAASPEAAIRSVLDAQVEAWNRADVETFMHGYLDSPAITFHGRSGITRGYAAVLERYRKNYTGAEKMGKLRFGIDEVRLLNNETALVLGSFHLTRSEAAGGDATGRFSLVFLKTKDGWKIVHDHTS